jgi:cell division septum initiation protein DivIVA
MVNPVEDTYQLLSENKKLEKQIKRLRKRLLEKQKYEAEMLIQTGATPQYIEKIRRKDEAALRED